MNIRAVAVLLAVTLAPAVSANAAPPAPFNPQQLVDQLAALTARVSTLEGTVSTLQGKVSKLEGNIVATDLAGTYAIAGLSTTMTAFHPPVGGDPAEPATINTSAFRGTLTLNTDGTGVTSGLSGEGSTLRLNGTMTGFDGGEPADTVKWTYADGVITITFQSDGDEIPFTVALGGRLLILAYAPFHPSDPSSDQFQIIATRLQ